MIHGHVYLIQQLRRLNPPAGSIIAEIGSMRERRETCSTVQLGHLCREKNWILFTVDMDPECIGNATQALNTIGCRFKTHVGKGEEWLAAQPEHSLQAVYLDAFDIVRIKNHHSAYRKSRYAKFMDGTKITNEASHQMHLACAKACQTAVAPGGLVVFDDILSHQTWAGKGQLAIPFLLKSDQFKIIQTPQYSVVMQRIGSKPTNNKEG